MSMTAGYRHEVGFYDSDSEFKDLILPFALEGIDSGEPVVFGYDEHKAGLLESWLGSDPGVSYLADASQYATPAKALASWRTVIETHLAAGASRVRIAGNVPPPGDGVPYVGWDRYEAAVDHALGDLPVWSPCLYDTRVASVDVIAAARSLHQHVLGPQGHRTPSPTFGPRTSWSEFLAPIEDPLVRSAPTVELFDPPAAQLRSALRELLAGRAAEQRTHALVLAGSEVVTNAHLYGTPPVSVRAWLADDHVIVDVADAGAGPSDPFVGLLPIGGPYASGGRGLWIVHQLELDVALLHSDRGFTIRLRSELQH